LLQIYGTPRTIILRDDKITDWKFINPTKEDLDFSKQIINQKKAELEDIDRYDPIAVLKNRHKYQIEDMRHDKSNK